MLRTRQKVMASALLTLVLTPSVAWSQVTTTFANFQQNDPNYNTPFRFINTGGADSRFGLYDASGAELTTTFNGSNYTGIVVNFIYQVPNGTGIQNVSIPAIMRMTSLVDGTTTPPGAVFNGDVIQQRFRNVNISFTGLVGDTAGRNLLTVTGGLSNTPINGAAPGNPNTNNNGSNGTTARLQGNVGENTASLRATESSGSNFYVGFTSDFLDFFTPTFTARSLTTSFNSISPAVNKGSNPSGNPDSSDYFRSFTASGSGDFASNPIPFNVPEPGTVVLLAFGALPALALRKRRR